MASPAPLLRPPIPGSRNVSGSRTPKLGLSIPASPNHKPVVNTQVVPPVDVPRPRPPKLTLATPMGSSTSSTPAPAQASRGRPPTLQIGIPARSVQEASSDDSGMSRDNSAGNRRGPESSSTPASALSLNMNALTLGNGKVPPSPSASPLERESSGHSISLPDLDQLAREKGRPLDVDDLDDHGWKAAAKEKMIVRISSLGEGAGGSVTRCRLRDGNTEFALKVIVSASHIHSRC